MSLQEKSNIGDAILIKLLQLLQEERESESEAAFNRVSPGDMIQIEHIFIVAAAKEISAAGESLSLTSLWRKIVNNDRAGFIGNSRSFCLNF